MNANAVHNVLNLLGLIIGSLIAFDWAGLGLSAETAAAIASGVLVADKVIKLAMNVVRDGVGGLWKVQPPVKSSGRKCGSDSRLGGGVFISGE